MKPNRKWLILWTAIALMLLTLVLAACRSDTTDTTEEHTHALVFHAAVPASCETVGNNG